MALNTLLEKTQPQKSPNINLDREYSSITYYDGERVFTYILDTGRRAGNRIIVAREDKNLVTLQDVCLPYDVEEITLAKNGAVRSREGLPKEVIGNSRGIKYFSQCSAEQIVRIFESWYGGTKLLQDMGEIEKVGELVVPEMWAVREFEKKLEEKYKNYRSRAFRE